MKKTLLATATLFFATMMGANAQSQIGIQAGANLANALVKYGSSTYDTKSNTGITGGLVIDIPISGAFHFRPELNYLQKGYKSESTVAGITSSEKAKFHYMDVPMNFTYNFGSGASKFFIGAGPSLGVGLGGEIKETTSGAGVNGTATTKVKFDGKDNSTDGNAHLKAFDLGVTGLAGVKTSMGLIISAGYNYGLTNLSPYANSDFRNKGFQIKLGYTISK